LFQEWAWPTRIRSFPPATHEVERALRACIMLLAMQASRLRPPYCVTRVSTSTCTVGERVAQVHEKPVFGVAEKTFRAGCGEDLAHRSVIGHDGENDAREFRNPGRRGSRLTTEFGRKAVAGPISIIYGDDRFATIFKRRAMLAPSAPTPTKPIFASGWPSHVPSLRVSMRSLARV